MDEENDISVGLMLWIMIGVAIMAACAIVSFSLFLVAYLAF